ncbi:hypothetical protein N2152v2_008181 [Parachlorella kessleri]
MNEAAAQPRRKPTNLTLDGLADLSEPLDGPLLAATPLSLLSPNALHAKASRSPAPAKSESPGALPSFNNRRSRPDPRRQSSAIFAGFAKATSGAGFLDDDEIAVGDEDILISLPVAAKSQVSGASHSTLWLEPHTEELLEGDLPEPAFDGAAASCGGQEELGFGAALGGGLAPIPESPSCSQGEATADETGTGAALGRSCSSPAQQPGLRPSSRASSRGPSPVKLPSRGATPQKDISTSCRGTSPQKPVSGVRDSTLLSEGLSKLCLEAGFDEWDTDDFELQDGNKVKEMAFLFKMESDAKAASPASSPKFSDATATALASCSASSTGEASSVKEKVGKLLQQEAAATKAAAVEGSARRAAAAKPAVAPSRPAAKAASSAAGSKAANSAARPGKFAPAPGARPSRLRPPSTSSSYFSHSTTGNSQAQQRHQATRRFGRQLLLLVAGPMSPMLLAGKQLPLLLSSHAISPSNDNLTPNTARIRFLEQHPELVFGGGSKVGNSPTSEEAEQLVRRKTAQERHLEEWGENL